MVNVREPLADKLTPEDEILKIVNSELYIVEKYFYLGNLSSLFMFPLVKHIFNKFAIQYKIYENNIWLYCEDNILQLKDHIFIVVSSETINQSNGICKLFNVLQDNSERWYFDGLNFIFAVKPILIDDYRKIIESNYSDLSPSYLKLCDDGGLIKAIITKNEKVKEEWVKFQTMIYPKGVPSNVPEMVTEDRYWPNFITQKETYYAGKDKKERY